MTEHTVIRGLLEFSRHAQSFYEQPRVISFSKYSIILGLSGGGLITVIALSAFIRGLPIKKKGAQRHHAVKMPPCFAKH